LAILKTVYESLSDLFLSGLFKYSTSKSEQAEKNNVNKKIYIILPFIFFIFIWFYYFFLEFYFNRASDCSVVRVSKIIEREIR